MLASNNFRNSPKHRHFSAFAYLNEWKPTFEPFILAYFILIFLSQITLLDYPTINTNSHLQESKFFLNLKKLSTYIYFTRNESFSFCHGNEKMFIRIITGLNLAYLILIILMLNRKNRSLQGYIMMALNYILMVFVLPIHVLYVDFIKNFLEVGNFWVFLGFIGILVSALYDYLNRELAFTVRRKNLEPFERKYDWL